MGEGNPHFMATAAASLTCRVAPQDSTLLGCVQCVAAASDRPVRPLHLQALLQLPRVADADGFVSISVAQSVIAQVAPELAPSAEWFCPGLGPSPRLLAFHVLDGPIAREVTERFHYLRSPRTGGRAYALSSPSGRLVALCVSSSLDVQNLSHLLVAHGRPSQNARVVSRVFAFEGTPKNSISYLLSRVGRSERDLCMTDLVTYVNPNMGFTGSSYKASGWRLLGHEPGTTYRYLDGRYITDRSLVEQFGKHDDATYAAQLGTRFAVSRMPLAPLLVFHSQLDSLDA